jgi:mannose-6-phosphate isomerase-like protein (cupin superfamily)
MKTLFRVLILTAIAQALPVRADSPSAETAVIPASAISQAIEAMPTKAAIDQPVRTLDTGAAHVGLFVVHRPQEADQGCTIEHDTLVNDRTTSIFIVIDGAGTLVTGGKLVSPVPLPADDPDLKLVGSGSRGSGIQNGQSRRIAKGDIIIIPAGVPHGFSAIENSITYEVVRIDSAKRLPIK